jgi:hypothetical protein
MVNYHVWPELFSASRDPTLLHASAATIFLKPRDGQRSCQMYATVSNRALAKSEQEYLPSYSRFAMSAGISINLEGEPGRMVKFLG